LEFSVAGSVRGEAVRGAGSRREKVDAGTAAGSTTEKVIQIQNIPRLHTPPRPKSPKSPPQPSSPSKNPKTNNVSS
jgi:hypothetical protein